MSLSSFGAIAGGINQGMDMNRRDEQLKEQLEASRQNRQAMADQNEYLKEQRDRQRKQQGRDDKLTEELISIPAPGQQKGIATDLGPDLKTQTEVGYAREKGLAYQRAGKDKEASELFRWANEADSKSAAQTWVQNLYSLPRNASLEEVVRVAGAGVDGDSSPVGVDHKNMRKNDDGSVTVRLYNKLTGASQERTFGSVGDLKEALTWHYAPDYAKSLYDKRLQTEQELQKNPVASVPDGYYDKRTGQFVRTRAAGDQVIGYNSEGEPIYGKGSSAGAGAGKSSKPQDPLKAADDAWEFSSTKGEVKLQPNQLATGLRMTRSMAADGVDPALAAEVALEVSTDPTKARLELNTETGTVDLVYRNPRVNGGRAIAISRNAGSMKEFESSVEGGPKAVKAQVQNMVTQAYGQNADRMIAIANDPELSRQYLESARERGMDTGPIANRLNLMRTYLAPASRQAAPASQPTQSRPLIDRLRTGFGINGASRGETDPNSPAGRFQARNAEAAKREDERRAQRSQAAAQLSEQFKKDAKTMDPLELVFKYDGQRMKLSSRDAAELRRIEEQAFRTSK